MFDVGIDLQEETVMLYQATARRMYELLLVGLSWRRLDDPGKLEHTCASVVRALCYAEVLPARVRQELPRNAALVTELMKNMGYVKDRRGLRNLIGTSSHDLIALVPGAFYSVGLVGPRGYGLVITAAGMVRAEGLYGTYDSQIDHAAFRNAWTANARQMRAMHGRLRDPDHR